MNECMYVYVQKESKANNIKDPKKKMTTTVFIALTNRHTNEKFFFLKYLAICMRERKKNESLHIVCDKNWIELIGNKTIT